MMLVLMLPALGLADLDIMLRDLDPMLFKQFLTGSGGAPYVLCRLRTMRDGAASETTDLSQLKLRDGPRRQALT